jgi:uncharacterized membrane protein
MLDKMPRIVWIVIGVVVVCAIMYLCKIDIHLGAGGCSVQCGLFK